jgi:hypothetical protein
VRGDKYDEKCDVYSFAVVLLGLLQLRRHVFELFTSALHERHAAESAATAAAKAVEAAAGVAPSNGSTAAATATTAAAAATDGGAANTAAAAAGATTGTGAKGAPRYTPHMVTVAIVTESLRPALPPVCSMIHTALAQLRVKLPYITHICRGHYSWQVDCSCLTVELGATATHTRTHTTDYCIPLNCSLLCFYHTLTLHACRLCPLH